MAIATSLGLVSQLEVVCGAHAEGVSALVQFGLHAYSSFTLIGHIHIIPFCAMRTLQQWPDLPFPMLVTVQYIESSAGRRERCGSRD